MERILSLFLPEPMALRLAWILGVLLVASPAVACDHFTRAYNTDATVDFCLWETDGTDLMTSATITAGEVKVSQSEGAEANCNDGSGACVTDEGSCYSLSLDATELDTARVYVTIIDTAAKTFLDKCIVIDTFGNASAQFPTADVNVTQISGDSAAADNVEAAFDGTATTELSGCPTGTADLVTMIKYLYTLGRNKFTSTSSTGTLFKDDAASTLCTFSTSDNGTTFTNGEGS